MDKLNKFSSARGKRADTFCANLETGKNSPCLTDVVILAAQRSNNILSISVYPTLDSKYAN